jgi:hypothetical protein
LTGNERSGRVHRAARVISEQLGCDYDESLGRLIIRADASSRSLERVAVDVTERMIRFSP